MSISARGRLGIAGVVVLGIGTAIVASRSEPAPQPIRASPGTTTTPSTEHPPMSPLDVQIDNLASLEAALAKSPSHSPILMRMAELARAQGDLSKAMTHLRQAVEAEPANLDACLELGRALYESGDVEGAIQETNKILDRSPNHVDALYNLGAIYANQNESGSASEYWKRAVAADPTSESGHNAQRGLDVLSGRVIPERSSVPATIPDIPEHRNLRRKHPAASGDPKRALIEFATKH